MTGRAKDLERRQTPPSTDDVRSISPKRDSSLPLTPSAATKRPGERLREPRNTSGNRDVPGLFNLIQGITGSYSRISVNDTPYNPEIIEKLVRRHDYEPENRAIIVRMPTLIHECFIASFKEAVMDSIKTMAQQENGSSRFHLKNSLRGRRRDPDTQFLQSNAFPPIVVEVSYSQDGKELLKLAEDYILGSEGNIRAVVGIDINPKGKGMASTISLWRPKLTLEGEDHTLKAGCDMLSKVFRTPEGLLANKHEKLHFSRSDFAIDEASRGGENPFVSIGFDELYSFLIEAEQQQSTRDAKRAKVLTGNIKMARQVSSYAEQLNSDDEACMSRCEEIVTQRADEADGDYEEPKGKKRVKIAKRSR